MLQDLHYGIRTLLQGKGWTVIVLLSLALGIGANTALFSLTDSALLRKLPVESPDELVFFDWVSGPTPMFVSLNGNMNKTDESMSSTSFSYLTYERFRENSRTLSDVFAYSPVFSGLTASIDGQPEVVSGQFVSGNYYTVLKVGEAAGRSITTADDNPSAEPVAVISHRFWQKRFGSDPATVGKNVVINRVSVTIAGVSAPGFEGVNGFGTTSDFSIPIAFEPQIRAPAAYVRQPWTWWVRMMGRLKRGSTPDQVQTEFERIFQISASDAWNAAPPQFRRSVTGRPPDTPRLGVQAGSRGFGDGLRRTSALLNILIPIFGLLLLIVCMNVANLLLARSAARQREIGVRLAMGASRRRIVRQLLTESVLIAVLAGIAGFALSYWGRDLLAAFLPAENNAAWDLRIDYRVFAFTAVVSLLAGILFGLAPALRTTGLDISKALKETSRTLSLTRSRLSKGLMAVQVAMSVVLLVGAGMFLGTLRNLDNVNVGFNAENLLLFRASPITLRYDAVRIHRLYAEMIERIEAMPGVTAATFSQSPLVSGSMSMGIMWPEGSDLRPNNGRVRRQLIPSNFFDTIGIPIVRGRNLSPADATGAPQVAVVNETLARQFFPDSDPIGKRFGLRPNQPADTEIVGVAKDIQDMTVRNNIMPTVYLSYLQQPEPLGTATFEIRTASDPLSLFPAVREVVRQIDSNLPLQDVKSQVQLIEESYTAERLLARASTFFGSVALLLASIGLYGMMSYSVTRRTGEIGVRMALGAGRLTVIWLILRETLLLIAVGAVIGVGASLGLTRLVTRMLFGISPIDPATIAVALLLMIAITALAGYLPALRASRVDPLIALRHE